MVTLKGDNFKIDAKAVVFDKDGTLTEGLKVWRKVFEKEMETARGMGLDIFEPARELFGVELDSQSTPLAVAYSKEEETLIAAAIWLSHHLDWDECRKKAKEIVKTASEKLTDEDLFIPVEGARQAVKLISKYVPVAIATSDSRENTLRLVKSWNLADDVDFVVTSSEVKNGKPAPDMLIRVCEIFDVEPSEVLMIGDNKVDVEMAKRAGCKCLTVGRKLDDANGWIENFTHLEISV